MKKTSTIIIIFNFIFGNQLVYAQTNKQVPIQEELFKQGVQLNLGYIVSAILNSAIALGFIALLFYFIRAAYQWLTAGGDKAQVEQARNGITNGLIGMALLASVFAIYSLVDNFFGIGIISENDNYLQQQCDNMANCSCGGEGCYCDGSPCFSGVCISGPSGEFCAL